MNNVNKKKLFTFLLVISIWVTSFYFFSNTSYAAEITGECWRAQSKTEMPEKKFNITEDQCTGSSGFCSEINANFCKFIPPGGTFRASDPKTKTITTDAATEWIKTEIGRAIVGLLTMVLSFAGKLLSLSGVIFGSMVDADIVDKVLNGQSVYSTWKIIRDFLNILFILVLLFSAFSTVFQVEKYNYKKVLLTLVLMALLVNFSFPITRFIIDISNSLMYTLLNQYFAQYMNSGSSIFGALADKSQLSTILTPPGDASIPYLISAIVFVFILAITFLAIGVLLVIRLVALAILIIFSPLAFVGSIVPGYLSSKAGEWWDNLFKYSFFGPIMIFMIYVATVMTTELSVTGASTFINVGNKNVIDGGLLAAMAYFVIPIVILWIGMGVAQSMSIAGAGAVMGQAQKLIKGTGKKVSGYNWIKKQHADYKKERDTRKEDARWKAGKNLGSKINTVQDSFMARAGFKGAQKRLDKRKTDKNKKDIDEGAKDLIDKGATTDSLAIDVNNTFNVTPTDPSGKVDQAKQAQAYLRQDTDERKMHLQNTLQAAAATAGPGATVAQIISASDLSNMLSAPPPASLAPGTAAYNAYVAAQTQAQAAAYAIATTPPGIAPSENDIRKVAAFVNRQMKSKVETGANA